MTKSERNEVVAKTLLEVVEALREGAAGPSDFWFKELANRIEKRAQNLTKAVAG